MSDKNGTIVKVSVTVFITAFLSLGAWVVSVQLDVNKYFQARIDQKVDVPIYGNDHRELSLRISSISEDIDSKFDGYNKVFHTRMNRMEERSDKKFEDINGRLSRVQNSLDQVAKNQMLMISRLSPNK